MASPDELVRVAECWLFDRQPIQQSGRWRAQKRLHGHAKAPKDLA